MAARLKTYYLLTYRDPEEDRIISLKVRRVEDSSLGPTFIAISDFVFDDSSVIIDPNVESRRRRLADTRKLHISLYHVISIAEVGRRNRGLDLSDRANLVMLPSSPPRSEK
ncbi:MAG: DUF1820 family protein [Deltaproteobacteria bacterium]|nr:DUF1820 family protein [Deltaproteobacteria bacterium]